MSKCVGKSTCSQLHWPFFCYSFSSTHIKNKIVDLKNDFMLNYGLNAEILKDADFKEERELEENLRHTPVLFSIRYLS